MTTNGLQLASEALDPWRRVDPWWTNRVSADPDTWIKRLKPLAHPHRKDVAAEIEAIEGLRTGKSSDKSANVPVFKYRDADKLENVSLMDVHDVVEQVYSDECAKDFQRTYLTDVHLAFLATLYPAVCVLATDMHFVWPAEQLPGVAEIESFHRELEDVRNNEFRQRKKSFASHDYLDWELQYMFAIWATKRLHAALSAAKPPGGFPTIAVRKELLRRPLFVFREAVPEVTPIVALNQYLAEGGSLTRGIARCWMPRYRVHALRITMEYEKFASNYPDRILQKVESARLKYHHFKLGQQEQNPYKTMVIGFKAKGATKNIATTKTVVGITEKSMERAVRRKFGDLWTLWEANGLFLKDSRKEERLKHLNEVRKAAAQLEQLANKTDKSHEDRAILKSLKSNRDKVIRPDFRIDQNISLAEFRSLAQELLPNKEGQLDGNSLSALFIYALHDRGCDLDEKEEEDTSVRLRRTTLSAKSVDDIYAAFGGEIVVRDQHIQCLREILSTFHPLGNEQKVIDHLKILPVESAVSLCLDFYESAANLSWLKQSLGNDPGPRDRYAFGWRFSNLVSQNVKEVQKGIEDADFRNLLVGTALRDPNDHLWSQTQQHLEAIRRRTAGDVVAFLQYCIQNYRNDIRLNYEGFEARRSEAKTRHISHTDGRVSEVVQALLQGSVINQFKIDDDDESEEPELILSENSGELITRMYFALPADSGGTPLGHTVSYLYLCSESERERLLQLYLKETKSIRVTQARADIEDLLRDDTNGIIGYLKKIGIVAIDNDGELDVSDTHEDLISNAFESLDTDITESVYYRVLRYLFLCESEDKTKFLKQLLHGKGDNSRGQQAILSSQDSADEKDLAPVLKRKPRRIASSDDDDDEVGLEEAPPAKEQDELIEEASQKNSQVLSPQNNPRVDFSQSSQSQGLEFRTAIEVISQYGKGDDSAVWPKVNLDSDHVWLGDGSNKQHDNVSEPGISEDDEEEESDSGADSEKEEKDVEDAPENEFIEAVAEGGEEKDPEDPKRKDLRITVDGIPQDDSIQTLLEMKTHNILNEYARTLVSTKAKKTAKEKMRKQIDLLRPLGFGESQDSGVDADSAPHPGSAGDPSENAEVAPHSDSAGDLGEDAEATPGSEDLPKATGKVFSALEEAEVQEFYENATPLASYVEAFLDRRKMGLMTKSVPFRSLFRSYIIEYGSIARGSRQWLHVKCAPIVKWLSKSATEEQAFERVNQIISNTYRSDGKTWEFPTRHLKHVKPPTNGNWQSLVAQILNATESDIQSPMNEMFEGDIAEWTGKVIQRAHDSTNDFPNNREIGEDVKKYPIKLFFVNWLLSHRKQLESLHPKHGCEALLSWYNDSLEIDYSDKGKEVLQALIEPIVICLSGLKYKAFKKAVDLLVVECTLPPVHWYFKLTAPAIPENLGELENQARRIIAAGRDECQEMIRTSVGDAHSRNMRTLLDSDKSYSSAEHPISKYLAQFLRSETVTILSENAQFSRLYRGHGMQGLEVYLHHLGLVVVKWLDTLSHEDAVEESNHILTSNDYMPIGKDEDDPDIDIVIKKSTLVSCVDELQELRENLVANEEEEYQGSLKYLQIQISQSEEVLGKAREEHRKAENAVRKPRKYDPGKVKLRLENKVKECQEKLEKARTRLEELSREGDSARTAVNPKEKNSSELSDVSKKVEKQVTADGKKYDKAVLRLQKAKEALAKGPTTAEEISRNAADRLSSATEKLEEYTSMRKVIDADLNTLEECHRKDMEFLKLYGDGSKPIVEWLKKRFDEGRPDVTASGGVYTESALPVAWLKEFTDLTQIPNIRKNYTSVIVGCLWSIPLRHGVIELARFINRLAQQLRVRDVYNIDILHTQLGVVGEPPTASSAEPRQIAEAVNQLARDNGVAEIYGMSTFGEISKYVDLSVPPVLDGSAVNESDPRGEDAAKKQVARYLVKYLYQLLSSRKATLNSIITENAVKMDPRAVGIIQRQVQLRKTRFWNELETLMNSAKLLRVLREAQKAHAHYKLLDKSPAELVKVKHVLGMPAHDGGTIVNDMGKLVSPDDTRPLVTWATLDVFLQYIMEREVGITPRRIVGAPLSVPCKIVWNALLFIAKSFPDANIADYVERVFSHDFSAEQRVALRKVDKVVRCILGFPKSMSDEFKSVWVRQKQQFNGRDVSHSTSPILALVEIAGSNYATYRKREMGIAKISYCDLVRSASLDSSTEIVESCFGYLCTLRTNEFVRDEVVSCLQKGGMDPKILWPGSETSTHNSVKVASVRQAINEWRVNFAVELFRHHEDFRELLQECVDYDKAVDALSLAERQQHIGPEASRTLREVLEDVSFLRPHEWKATMSRLQWRTNDRVDRRLQFEDDDLQEVVNKLPPTLRLSKSELTQKNFTPAILERAGNMIAKYPVMAMFLEYITAESRNGSDKLREIREQVAKKQFDGDELMRDFSMSLNTLWQDWISPAPSVTDQTQYTLSYEKMELLAEYAEVPVVDVYPYPLERANSLSYTKFTTWTHWYKELTFDDLAYDLCLTRSSCADMIHQALKKRLGRDAIYSVLDTQGELPVVWFFLNFIAPGIDLTRSSLDREELEQKCIAHESIINGTQRDVNWAQHAISRTAFMRIKYNDFASVLPILKQLATLASETRRKRERMSLAKAATTRLIEPFRRRQDEILAMDTTGRSTGNGSLVTKAAAPILDQPLLDDNEENDLDQPVPFVHIENPLEIASKRMEAELQEIRSERVRKAQVDQLTKEPIWQTLNTNQEQFQQNLDQLRNTNPSLKDDISGRNNRGKARQSVRPYFSWIRNRIIRGEPPISFSVDGTEADKDELKKRLVELRKSDRWNSANETPRVSAVVIKPLVDWLIEQDDPRLALSLVEAEWHEAKMSNLDRLIEARREVPNTVPKRTDPNKTDVINTIWENPLWRTMLDPVAGLEQEFVEVLRDEQAKVFEEWIKGYKFGAVAKAEMRHSLDDQTPLLGMMSSIALYTDAENHHRRVPTEGKKLKHTDLANKLKSLLEQASQRTLNSYTPTSDYASTVDISDPDYENAKEYHYNLLHFFKILKPLTLWADSDHGEIAFQIIEANRYIEEAGEMRSLIGALLRADDAGMKKIYEELLAQQQQRVLLIKSSPLPSAHEIVKKLVELCTKMDKHYDYDIEYEWKRVRPERTDLEMSPEEFLIDTLLEGITFCRDYWAWQIIEDIKNEGIRLKIISPEAPVTARDDNRDFRKSMNYSALGIQQIPGPLHLTVFEEPQPSSNSDGVPAVSAEKSGVIPESSGNVAPPPESPSEAARVSPPKPNLSGTPPRETPSGAPHVSPPRPGQSGTPPPRTSSGAPHVSPSRPGRSGTPSPGTHQPSFARDDSVPVESGRSEPVDNTEVGGGAQGSSNHGNVSGNNDNASLDHRDIPESREHSQSEPEVDSRDEAVVYLSQDPPPDRHVRRYIDWDLAIGGLDSRMNEGAIAEFRANHICRLTNEALIVLEIRTLMLKNKLKWEETLDALERSIPVLIHNYEFLLSCIEIVDPLRVGLYEVDQRRIQALREFSAQEYTGYKQEASWPPDDQRPYLVKGEETDYSGTFRGQTFATSNHLYYHGNLVTRRSIATLINDGTDMTTSSSMQPFLLGGDPEEPRELDEFKTPVGRACLAFAYACRYQSELLQYERQKRRETEELVDEVFHAFRNFKPSNDTNTRDSFIAIINATIRHSRLMGEVELNRIGGTILNLLKVRNVSELTLKTVTLTKERIFDVLKSVAMPKPAAELQTSANNLIETALNRAYKPEDLRVESGRMMYPSYTSAIWSVLDISGSVIEGRALRNLVQALQVDLPKVRDSIKAIQSRLEEVTQGDSLVPQTPWSEARSLRTAQAFVEMSIRHREMVRVVEIWQQVATSSMKILSGVDTQIQRHNLEIKVAWQTQKLQIGLILEVLKRFCDYPTVVEAKRLRDQLWRFSQSNQVPVINFTPQVLNIRQLLEGAVSGNGDVTRIVQSAEDMVERFRGEIDSTLEEIKREANTVPTLRRENQQLVNTVSRYRAFIKRVSQLLKASATHNQNRGILINNAQRYDRLRVATWCQNHGVEALESVQDETLTVSNAVLALMSDSDIALDLDETNLPLYNMVTIEQLRQKHNVIADDKKGASIEVIAKSNI